MLLRRLLGLLVPVFVCGLHLGCEDPIPPSREGAAWINFTQPTQKEGMGKQCMIARGEVSVAGQVGDKTFTAKTDGQEGVEVDCKVTGSGPFDVSARIQLGANFVQLSASGVSDAAKMTPIDATVGVFTDATQTTYISTPSHPCKLTVIEVAAGRLWAGFRCPLVFPKGNEDESSVCAIINDSSESVAGGYIYLNNCDQ